MANGKMCKLLYIYMLPNTTSVPHGYCVYLPLTMHITHHTTDLHLIDAIQCPGKRFHLCWLHGIIKCILKLKCPIHRVLIDRRQEKIIILIMNLWYAKGERTKCCHELIKIWLTLVVDVLQLIEFVSRAINL